MEPLTVNPGGELASDQVVGRDREIERYWQILARQGLILAAERRIGKTSIVRKMHEDGRDGFLTVYQDLEHVHSLPELIRSVYASADEHFTRLSRIKSIQDHYLQTRPDPRGTMYDFRWVLVKRWWRRKQP